MRMSYAVLIQDQLKRVGVQMRIDAMEGPKFGQRLEARDFDAMLNTASTDPSPSGAVQFWGTEGAKPGGSNYVSYSDPRFDALLDSALSAWDPAVSRQFAVRAYQVVADDAPAVWLYDLLTVGAINRRIRTTRLRGDEWWAHLEDWSIPPAERIDRDRIGLGAPKP
jgi:ABC-type transport system substrate-binding protein